MNSHGTKPALFLGPICRFLLLGKTNSYRINSFSLPIVPYTFLFHLVTSSSCISGLSFDGGIVSNRGLFQSRCENKVRMRIFHGI